MNVPYAFKRCSKCGEWLVASKVNFNKIKGGKYGLKSECRQCNKERSKQWREENKDKIKQYRENNKDKILEYRKQYRENNKDKILEYMKQYREDNKDKISEYMKQYYENNKDKKREYDKHYREDNKDKILEYWKQYREDNKDKILEYMKQYSEDNKDKIRERSKQYRENNKDKILEYMKQYRENNKDKISERTKYYRATPQGQVVTFNSTSKRRIKEKNQGNGINKKQWLEMMNYFNWECAYSDETLTKDTRSIDHIVPLNKGGKHEIWNVVPMYKPYNSSKQDKGLLEWYKEQPFFSEERLQKIYEWQEYAYNKWHKEEII